MKSRNTSFIYVHLKPADYDDIQVIMDRVYTEIDMDLPKSKYVRQLKAFPEGQICIEGPWCSGCRSIFPS